ncbi:hypothetical protein SDRG_02780 [Saprolegnia diclina VS20]|uniref:PSP1 C-terminal domain-containing protein n=1 Tax=Saprolegnia diclina (strain VS20) TaxID=1156394 RepID=T0R1D8_SAPDV|nr:hypothetical protein SDRG_02780 [Saprolegnia diclina VS20]EQC40130.1 hypothetical protein SDRG_02780 [Saprolegnia diclina VS20]|eukprot:XP_008606604.1 hypothetical protein SDRG_02780 [Saprolegnia diclina VS20]
MVMQTDLPAFPIHPVVIIDNQEEDLRAKEPVIDGGDDDSTMASQKEWSDFLNSSVLALKLEEPVDEDSARPKPIAIGTPTQKQLRAGSPLVLCMSPLATIPPIPSMVNSPEATAAVNPTSWPSWQMSIPDTDDVDEDDNDGDHSPLGIPLLSEKQHATEKARRMRAKSFSAIYAHEHHAAAWSSERHDGLGLSNNNLPPPLPHLQLPPTPYQAAPMQSVSNFNMRRYSGDFDHYGHRSMDLASSSSSFLPPPPPMPTGNRGIRSHSIECHTSSSHMPRPPSMGSPYHAVTRSPMLRQNMRQPPLPTKQSGNQYAEWQRPNDFAPPLPPDAGAYYGNPTATATNGNSNSNNFAEYMPEAYYEVQFKRCRKDVFSGLGGFKLGDYVKVEGDRGEDVGHVIRMAPDAKTLRSTNDSESKEPAPMKRVMRLASENELTLLREQHKEEQEVLQVCRSKVRQRMLPMNVIDAEYQFDRHKLTFFFEADRRIDFRELVRDLFAIYKTRIWLQQVVSVHKKGMAPEFELADGHH